MIPLTTKLPAICSLLRRVLEMEEKATPDWHYEEDDEGSSMGWIMSGNESLFDVRGDSAQQAQNAELCALTRNITKPQATALLGDIQNFTFLLSPCFGDKTNAFAQAALQSIADAFPDALFQDSSRCA